MDLDFAEQYAATRQDVIPSPEFARKYVYVPLKKIVDALNSETNLVSVVVLKTIAVGQETARVICALVTPLSMTRLENVGGMQTTIRENCPAYASLVNIAYEPVKRHFDWRVEFVFSSATRARLVEVDRVAAKKSASAANKSVSDAENLAIPLDVDDDKEGMLAQRRRIEEESRLLEAEIRTDRTNQEISRLTSARAEQTPVTTRASTKSTSLIRRTVSVAPAEKVVVGGRKRPAPAIAKDGKHAKAKPTDDIPKFLQPARPPSILSTRLPFLNRLLCFIAGIEHEGANSAASDYVKSHEFDTDLFLQTK